MKKISLSIQEQCNNYHKNLDAFSREQANPSTWFEDKESLYFYNAKKAIHYLIHEYNLTREDEVFITTTSDSNYVASCVTSTVFNYCKVSRVLTEKTKMIYIIHEFGFPHKELLQLIQAGQQRGIPVIEDVAHTIDSFYMGKRLGMHADYGIYSIPKFFPVAHGGILIGNKLDTFNPNYHQKIADKVRNEFIKYSVYLKSFTEKRRGNYKMLQDAFSNYELVWELEDHLDPYAFGFKTGNFSKIYEKLHIDGTKYQLQPCYVKDWVVIPTNQFIGESQYLELITDIYQII